jgi:hypothetical protein
MRLIINTAEIKGDIEMAAIKKEISLEQIKEEAVELILNNFTEEQILSALFECMDIDVENEQRWSNAIRSFVGEDRIKKV